jgi:hypothetical protein
VAPRIHLNQQADASELAHLTIGKPVEDTTKERLRAAQRLRGRKHSIS